MPEFQFTTAKEVVAYVEARNNRRLSNFERLQAMAVTQQLIQSGGMDLVNKLLTDVEIEFAQLKK